MNSQAQPPNKINVYVLNEEIVAQSKKQKVVDIKTSSGQIKSQVHVNVPKCCCLCSDKVVCFTLIAIFSSLPLVLLCTHSLYAMFHVICRDCAI